MRKIIRYSWDKMGEFIERRNRFLGIVGVEGKLLKVHIHDSGRLEEILYKGNTVFIKKARGEKRKTHWDLLLGKVNEYLIPVNSAYHRKISEVLIKKLKIFGDIKDVKPEFKFKESRIDFFLEKENGENLLLEVKGCTLSKNKVALFPDAPTSRGAKHINSLISAVREGFQPYLLILVLRPDSTCFLPNKENDPYFAKVFYKGLKEGIKVKPILIEYKDGWLYYKGEIPLCGKEVEGK
ncbi:MAG: DNA/RNA nuclease SfsA [Caldiserica bacterium]|nr:MAG: DNA/RNA nuclease SfsA [Caldisericota bacterium]